MVVRTKPKTRTSSDKLFDLDVLGPVCSPDFSVRCLDNLGLGPDFLIRISTGPDNPYLYGFLIVWPVIRILFFKIKKPDQFTNFILKNFGPYFQIEFISLAQNRSKICSNPTPIRAGQPWLRLFNCHSRPSGSLIPELEEIREAYLLEAKRHHPDAGGSDPAHFQAIHEAYEAVKKFKLEELKKSKKTSDTYMYEDEEASEVHLRPVSF